MKFMKTKSAAKKTGIEIFASLLILATMPIVGQTQESMTQEQLVRFIALQKTEIEVLKSRLVSLQEDVAKTVPSQAVLFFNSETCPNGWAPLPLANGRYVVGVTHGNDIGKTVGEPLGNTENRAVGKHFHPVTDPGHAHKIGPLFRNS